jgi:hypothetical protein
MSKYAELTKLALKYVTTFKANGRDCVTFASTLAKGLADYLECPEGCLAFMSVESVEPYPVPGETQGDVRAVLPKLLYHRDGFRYFALALTFHLGMSGHHQIFFLGIKLTGKTYMLRANKDIPFPSAEGEEAQEFYRSLFEEIVAGFKNIHSGRLPRIGFSPNPAAGTS